MHIYIYTVPGSDGLLVYWDAKKSKADVVVAQDGSGNYKTINEAVDALGKTGTGRGGRRVVHVKAGVYHENVEISRKLKDLMFVGDGMDKTIVTGHKSVVGGSTTLSSATFGTLMFQLCLFLKFEAFNV